jgi:hypothetical protein
VNRWVVTLLLVLLIQFGIVAAVFWPHITTPAVDEPLSLAGFLDDSIDEIRIGDDYDNETVLVKTGGQWLLGNLEGLPADPDKVGALLTQLGDKTQNWPVAHSAAARQRFQVADYLYQRRLVFMTGGKPLGTVYLGTSPGFRKIHARSAGQDAIFSISLNSFEIPTTAGAWLEPRLLQVRAPLRIDTDLYNLYLDNGSWRSVTGGTPDEDEMNALIEALKTLQVGGVADEDSQRELSATEADLELQIEGLAGTTMLQLLTLGSEHYIHSSEYPLYFKLSAFDFDRLTGIDVALISGETAPETRLPTEG